MSQDPWSSLETDWEGQLPSEVKLESLVPETINQRLQDAQAARFLSGSLFFAGLLLLGFALAALARGEATQLGYSLFVVPILAWLLMPLFPKGRRVSSLYLLLSPVIVGGVAEIASAVVRSLVDSQLQTNFDRWYLLEYLRQALSGYLSYQHFAIYGAAGVLLWASTRHLERKFYWLDLKRFHPSVVMLCAICWVGLPVVFLSSALSTHGWTPSEQQWIASQSQRPEAQSFWEVSVRKQSSAWPDITEYWPTTPASKIRQWESTLYRLWPALELEKKPSVVDLARARLLLDSLMQQHEELAHPQRVAQITLRFKVRFQCYFSSKAESALLERGLLDYLAEAPLEEIGKTETSFSLAETWRVANDLTPLMDAGAYRILTTAMGYQLGEPYNEVLPKTDRSAPKLRPLMVFGRPTDLSPASLYARRQARSALKTWLTLRERAVHEGWHKVLMKHPVSALETADDYWTNVMLAQARSTLQRSQDPVLQSAMLIVLLRKAHQDSGKWPQSWQEVAPAAPAAGNWREIAWDPSNHTLRVTFSSRVAKREAERSWVLR